MFRCVSALFFVAMMVLPAAPAKAQWFHNFWDDFCRNYKRNQAWPEPFLRADRESVITPIGLQVSNGWRKQNLLSEYHFTEDSPQLTQAGELKVQYILTQMPPQRRTIFVQRGMNPDVTATRVAVVQRAASRMMPFGSMADVVESDLPSDGWAADDIDSVSRKWQNTRPDPRLKSTSGGDSGGGASQ